MEDKQVLGNYPILIIRGKVLFPNIYTNFDVSRPKSLEAVVKAMSSGSKILVVTQKNAFDDDPKPQDLHRVGVICRIKKVLKISETNLRVHIQSDERAVIQYIEQEEGYYKATVLSAPDIRDYSDEELAYLSVAKQKLAEYTTSRTGFTPELKDALSGIENPEEFVNVAAFNLPITESDKQRILEERQVAKRLESLLVSLSAIVERQEIEKTIQERVQRNVEKNQKEYFLREQLRAIHTELGDDESEIENLREQIKAKNMPEEDKNKVLKELDRMSRMSSSSPDYTVLRTYIDWIVDLPFGVNSKDRENLSEAIKILDGDHFGLEKVKERIIEYIAVLKLTKKVGSSILCLVGPPGVGKTSVATSIARALDRKFVRMSLGGVKDEAEIRGHRKTYIGAMPGRIIYGIKNAGVSNPVFLLDEIDKLSSDLRGDPASALLEVLDPEQNKTFRDRYIEIPYDLSDVLFITTANSLETIPAPLLDRMEIISLDGYTREEKTEIAKRYLIPKRLERNGLTAKNVAITDEALDAVIKGYTLEAGVRNLERQIDAILRKIATKLAEKGSLRKQTVKPENLVDYLGSPRFSDSENLQDDEVGAANGLAWTMYGGTTLTIEVSVMSGKGEILLTGKLGDVMKESARAAISYIRAHAKTYGVDEKAFTEKDIHIHVPEGATPKDGPSAGVTMATAILSALTEKKVRKDIAMTGEITLRGKVLPIGGLKEKALAAFRTGIYEIIIPKKNLKDVEDIPKNIANKMKIIPVENVSEIFSIAIRDIE